MQYGRHRGGLLALLETTIINQIASHSPEFCELLSEIDLAIKVNLNNYSIDYMKINTLVFVTLCI